MRIVKRAVRPLVAGGRGPRLPGARRALRAPGVRSGGDGRQRHHRRSRSPRTCPTSTPCWCPTAAAGCRAASPRRSPPLRPGARVIATEAGDGGAARRVARGRRAAHRRLHRELRRRHRQRGAARGDVAAGARSAGRLGTRHAGADGRRRAAPGGAPPRDRGGRRRHLGGGCAARGSPARAGSSASSPAATSTPPSCARSWTGACPDQAGPCSRRAISQWWPAGSAMRPIRQPWSS